MSAIFIVVRELWAATLAALHAAIATGSNARDAFVAAIPPALATAAEATAAAAAAAAAALCPGSISGSGVLASWRVTAAPASVAAAPATLAASAALIASRDAYVAWLDAYREASAKAAVEMAADLARLFAITAAFADESTVDWTCGCA